MLVTNVEQGKNNTFTFPIAFKNNLYFYWAFDYAGYFYNLIIKNKDINSCYIYDGLSLVGLKLNGIHCCYMHKCILVQNR